MLSSGEKTVAIAKSLLYYRYYPLWETFFSELGVRLSVSGFSSAKTLKIGSTHAHADSCVPIKLAFGHIGELLEKKADYLFLPRFLRLEEKSYVCPKMIGFTDMVKCLVIDPMKKKGENPPKIIDSTFDVHNFSNKSAFRNIGYNFSWNPFKIDRAYERGVSCLNGILSERMKIFKSKRLTEHKYKIGVLGHPYNIHDDFVNTGIMNELKKRDAVSITTEDIDIESVKCDFSKFPSGLFWAFGREIYKTAAFLIKNDDFKTDGVIYVSPFGCGLDSIMLTIVQNEFKSAGIPFLPLTVDEHTARAGLITRIEAFMDMLE
ncbi:MAG TPA: acyl-CoA dehydratase activase-related protein [Candidatus Wallbacteria bacterium]|nr:acyl-CoA dehydratase activase-related protein [Candidatus Wallbacteria bacterium]